MQEKISSCITNSACAVERKKNITFFFLVFSVIFMKETVFSHIFFKFNKIFVAGHNILPHLMTRWSNGIFVHSTFMESSCTNLGENVAAIKN